LGAKAKPTTESWSRWKDVRPMSASSRIVEQVRAALFRGELKPGDMIGSETDLARKLGVSRVPVRDAFKTLQAMGIVEVKMGVNGGARVAAGDPSRFADALAVQFQLVGISIDEMFDAQIATEVMAAELAAKRATEADLQRLREIVAELQSISAKSMSVSIALRFTTISMQFHEALVDAAHNRALAAQFNALRHILEPVYARHTSNAVAKRVIASHKAVIDSIASHDADRACTLIRRRLETIRATKLEKSPIRLVKNPGQTGV
jgi:GntR family transcriptional regulator, transcriptional repressor for pyruvate dehydrogenase complex